MKHSKKTCKYIIIRGLKAECSKYYKHSEVDRTLLHPFFYDIATHPEIWNDNEIKAIKSTHLTKQYMDYWAACIQVVYVRMT